MELQSLSSCPPHASIMSRALENRSPPTPPPLPDFIKRKIESKETSKPHHYPRQVKLILPNEPPGETSTDGHFDVVVARKENARNVN